VIAIPSDDGRFTDGIVVTTTVVGQTRIFWVTFWTTVTRFAFTSVSDTVFTSDTVGIGVTGVTNGAPVNSITSGITVTSEVVTTDAIVALWLIDALGIDVTDVVTSLAFIYGADEGIVVTGKPEGPLSSVGWSALSVHVIGQCFNTVEKIFGGGNVVKVDKMTWYSTGSRITFGTISLC